MPLPLVAAAPEHPHRAAGARAPVPEPSLAAAAAAAAALLSASRVESLARSTVNSRCMSDTWASRAIASGMTRASSDASRAFAADDDADTVRLLAGGIGRRAPATSACGGAAVCVAMLVPA